MTKQHISFSELKTWAECPFKHRLKYIDGINGFTGNIFTAFGTAIHSVCEHIAKGVLEPLDYDEHFDLAFLCELKKLDDKPDNKMIAQMRTQGKEISPSVFPQLKEHFGEYEVFSTEEMLYVDIEELSYKWHLKGFIDLVIKTEDGKYHILDWKSCSWGWDAKKRSEKLVTYQLTLYKKFFCKNWLNLKEFLNLKNHIWSHPQKKWPTSEFLYFLSRSKSSAIVISPIFLRIGPNLDTY